MPKGLPKRVRNDHKKSKRARSWERGQKRKEERRETQRDQARQNRAAVKVEGFSETQQNLSKWTKGRSVGWSRKPKPFDPSLRIGTMTRSTAVRSLRRTHGSVVIATGWQFICLNCPERKSFLYTHFSHELSHMLAVTAATDHMCVPDRFRAAEANVISRG